MFIRVTVLQKWFLKLIFSANIKQYKNYKKSTLIFHLSKQSNFKQSSIMLNTEADFSTEMVLIRQLL